MIQLAINVARNSESKIYKHGAVLCSGSNVINIGYNKQDKTHTIAKNYYSQTIHAEIDCLIGITIPSNPILYVARINSEGQIRNSKPCKHCQKILSKLGIKKIYFTTSHNIEKL
jgi:deoxycytidylate deaminase